VINTIKNYFIDFIILATLEKVFKEQIKIKKKIVLQQIKNIII